MATTHVFFDIGGVLGTNGWDRTQRKVAVEKFHLDAEDFQCRHEEVAGPLEEGAITLDEYLDITVFCVPRDFSREEFRTCMYAQSRAFPETIAIARAVAESGTYWVMTLNNESDELNRHRISEFGLDAIFDAFLSSCWLGLRKPTHAFYHRALSIAHANPAESVFVDDRQQNLAPATALGMRAVHYTTAKKLQADLIALGIQFNHQPQ